ncbi:hypothetical protein ACN28G_14695 [Micromonospora sp. WMMA1923]|uniref:hypothetical protein n=1 Tax=Micromonospora sp. WMMA1923 TaxID=3404125 RepID=UPI003B9600B8
MTLHLLLDAERGLHTDADPDGLAAQTALLVAYSSAMSAAALDNDTADNWTFAALSIREGLGRLTEQLHDVPTPIADPPQLDPQNITEARPRIRALVAALAAFYTAAAQRESGLPWRRLAWASVAQHLDRAARETP